DRARAGRPRRSGRRNLGSGAGHLHGRVISSQSASFCQRQKDTARPRAATSRWKNTVSYACSGRPPRKRTREDAMLPNEVRIETAVRGSEIRIAESFNAAVPFIDRHVNEGRGAKPIIKTHDGETVTYGELAERVNRCGNGLKSLGIAPGERALMI